MPRAKDSYNTSHDITTDKRTIPIDYDKVAMLAQIGCTYEEIAAACGMHLDTLWYRRKRDPKLSAILEHGRSTGRASLRRMQWRSARKGSVAMQKWLGKQLLNQSEKSEITVHSTGGGMDSIDPTKLTDEELALLQTLVAKAQKTPPDNSQDTDNILTTSDEIPVIAPALDVPASEEADALAAYNASIAGKEAALDALLFEGYANVPFQKGRIENLVSVTDPRSKLHAKLLEQQAAKAKREAALATTTEVSNDEPKKDTDTK